VSIISLNHVTGHHRICKQLVESRVSLGGFMELLKICPDKIKSAEKLKKNCYQFKLQLTLIILKNIFFSLTLKSLIKKKIYITRFSIQSLLEHLQW
jgi:hypothetical protein